MEKKEYKILIVACGASLIQLLPLVKSLRNENPCAVVHLLTDQKMDGVTKDICKHVSVVIKNREHSTRLGKFWLGRYISKCLFWIPIILLSIRKYDVVNIHWARPKLLPVMPWLKKMSSNIIISTWGSDVLRVDDEEEIRIMREIYTYASHVTCSPDSQLAQGVIDKFKYDPSKIHAVRFGADYFDYVNEVKPSVTVDEAKDRYGLKDRYVITCGYANNTSHQHIAIIDAVGAIKDKLPNNLTLLFPCTYGLAGPQYIQFIKDKCNQYSINAVCVEEYLNLADLYSLRMATDMFINIPVTDACSASVMQYFVCRKKVVHGAWVKYPYLRGFESSYFPINKIEDLSQSILQAYNAKDVNIPDELVQQILDKGWNTVIKRWNEIFTCAAYGLSIPKAE